MTRASDHENVSIYRHSDEQLDQLLTKAKECVLMWATKDHWPVGVVHAYVWQKGKVWLTFTAQRHRATAIRRDNRVSVTVSGACSDDPECPKGAVTLKGLATFHDDRETKEWFYRALSNKGNPDDPTAAQDFYDLLDSPLRVVLEIEPVKWISFDADKSARHRAGTLSEDELSAPLSSDTSRIEAERKKRGMS
ncbi:MAG: hypothetical protein AB8B93_09840 [Pseudomonadales bacterium]